jgi:hypothetical protein
MLIERGHAGQEKTNVWVSLEHLPVFYFNSDFEIW